VDEKTLINRLNWFYSLELNQVDLYTAQSKSVNDIYLSKVLARTAVIEQQHVDNIAAEIKKRGFTPTFLGDVLGPILGKVAGKLSGVMGPKTILEMDIALETRAMKDYKNLIMRVGDESLFDLLWDNLIDEDLHTAWFANKLRELSRRIVIATDE
jgi:bacterioferritin